MTDRSIELEITGRSEGLSKATTEARAEVAELTGELAELKTTAGESSTEVSDLEGNLGELKTEAEETSTAVDDLGTKTESTGFKLKDLGKGLIAGFSALTVVRENIKGISEQLGIAGREYGDFIDGLDGGNPVLEQAKNQFVAMLNPLKILPSIFDNFDIAFRKWAEGIVGNSEVMGIPAAKAEEIRQKFLATRPAVDDLAKAHEEGAAKAEESSDRSAKAADRRAKAEEDASARATAALERESAARDKAITDSEKRLADLEARHAKENAQGGAGGSPLAGAAEEAANLRQEVSALEDQPILSLEQVNRLDDAKTKLAGLTQQMETFNEQVVFAAENHLTEAQAQEEANAQLDVAIALSRQRYEAQNQLLAGQEASTEATEANRQALADLEGQIQNSVRGGFTDLTESAEQAHEEITGAAKGMGKLADETKQLGEEKGLENALAQSKEVNAELRISVDLVRQLRAELAQVDI